jgi:hypothetical protein
MRPGLNHDSTLKIGYREISVGKNAGTVGKLINKSLVPMGRLRREGMPLDAGKFYVNHG